MDILGEMAKALCVDVEVATAFYLVQIDFFCLI